MTDKGTLLIGCALYHKPWSIRSLPSKKPMLAISNFRHASPQQGEAFDTFVTASWEMVWWIVQFPLQWIQHCWDKIKKQVQPGIQSLCRSGLWSATSKSIVHKINPEWQIPVSLTLQWWQRIVRHYSAPRAIYMADPQHSQWEPESMPASDQYRFFLCVCAWSPVSVNMSCQKTFSIWFSINTRHPHLF